MKKTATLIALFVLVTGSVFANENDDSNADEAFVFVKGKEQTYNLIYPGKIQGTVSIQFLNPNGKRLHLYQVKNEYGFKKPFDFSQVQPGVYTVKVKDKLGEYHQRFEVESALEMSVVKQGNTHRLIANHQSGESLRVNIYDADDNLIHVERHREGFSRKFDLSAIASNHFTFEVIGGEESQKIKVD
jgi:hypothetical protein